MRRVQRSRLGLPEMSTATDEEVLREVIEHISMAYVRLERLSEKTYHTPRVAAFEHAIAQAFKTACEIEEALNDEGVLR